MFHVLLSKTVSLVVGKQRKQTSWPNKSVRRQHGWYFAYLVRNVTLQPETHTARSPLTSSNLLDEPGRKQIRSYFSISEQSFSISDNSVVRTDHSQKRSLCSMRDVTRCSLPDSCVITIGQQIIELDRISWITGLESRLCRKHTVSI